MGSYGIAFTPVSILVHVLGVVVLGLTLAWVIVWRGGVNLFSSNSSLIFNAHPVIQIGGFIFISSEAILIYKTATGTTKRNQKLIHLILQGIAFLFALLGVWAAYDYHVLQGIDNFYSFHSWLGLGTLGLFLIQWLIGFVSFWLQGIGSSARAAVLPWHVFLGLAIYVLAIGTAASGFFEKLTFLQLSLGVGHYVAEAIFVNTLTLVLVLFGLVTVLAAVIPGSKERDGYQPIN